MCIRDRLGDAGHVAEAALFDARVRKLRALHAEPAGQQAGAPELLFERVHPWLREVLFGHCLLYTSDAADERSSVDLGGRRIIKKKRTKKKKKKHEKKTQTQYKN